MPSARTEARALLKSEQCGVMCRGELMGDPLPLLARDIQSYLREQMPVWREQHPGVEEMTVAVMGCVVNGPGESKHANIGISLPGTGERPVPPVYVDGEKTVTLKGERIAEEFQQIVDDYVIRHYSTLRTVVR